VDLQAKQVMRQVAIPKEAYTGTCNQLFDFLANQLADFIKEQECGEVGLPSVEIKPGHAVMTVSC